MMRRFIIFIISLCNFFPNIGTMQAFVIRILIDTLQGYLEVDVYIEDSFLWKLEQWNDRGHIGK